MSLTDIIKRLDDTYSASDDPLLLHNRAAIHIISGRKGSGKSTLLLSLLNSKKAWKRRFNAIFMVSPTAQGEQKFAKLVEELSDDGRFYDMLNEQVMEEIFDKVRGFNDDFKESKKRKKPRFLLILDDCVLDISKKKDSVLNRMVIISRHLNLTVVVLTQKYNAVNTLLRANADTVCQFGSLNAREITCLQDDINVDKDVFNRLYIQATQKPNGFLWVNLIQNPPVFYDRFDKMDVPEFRRVSES